MGKYKNSYFQKSNYLELKTLEYYFGGDINKARNVFNIRHKLNSRGFEIYIKYCLKELGFNMSAYTGGYKADGGIDLKCKYPPLYVQCKKYMKNHTHKRKVSIGELRNFYGGVVSIYKGNIIFEQ
ncbi:MAG: restriction endonuclease [Candidatus Gracilibacteria bacterium]